jgi:hypothetical protein
MTKQEDAMQQWEQAQRDYLEARLHAAKLTLNSTKR